MTYFDPSKFTIGFIDNELKDGRLPDKKALRERLASELVKLSSAENDLQNQPTYNTVPLALAAVILDDSSLFNRLADYRYKIEDFHYWRQRDNGMNKEDFGPKPTHKKYFDFHKDVLENYLEDKPDTLREKYKKN